MRQSVVDQVVMAYAYTIIGLVLLGAIALTVMAIARVVHIVW